MGFIFKQLISSFMIGFKDSFSNTKNSEQFQKTTLIAKTENPNPNPKVSSLLSLAISLPITWGFSIIIYILIGAKGTIWAFGALNFIMLATIWVNTFSYFFVILNPHRRTILTSITFSVIIIFGFILSGLGCFPGTGNRHSNCGADIFVFIGLANVILIFLLNLPMTLWMILATGISFPIITLIGYFFISHPLWTALKQLNLQEICLVQKAQYENLSKAKRISSLDQIKLSYFIGEHSPRIIMIQGMKIQFWQYSKSEFSKSYVIQQIPNACSQK